jgi:hypothetical protein
MNKVVKKAAARKVVSTKPVAIKKSAVKLAKPVAKSAKIPSPVVPVKKTVPIAPVTSKPLVKHEAKAKLVRDSFTLPEADHALLKACKKMALTSGRETKKSEVVRAAIRAFSALSAAQQLAAYQALPQIAVGRPKSKR